MQNKTLPARPCMPVQDNLGRLIAPIPGMTKEEVVLLSILSGMTSNPLCFKLAVELTEEYFNHFQNKKQDGKQQSGIIS